MTVPGGQRVAAGRADAAGAPDRRAVGVEGTGMVSLVPGARWPALPSPYGMNVLALLFQFEQSQWLPPDVLRALQFRQLGLLLSHAYEQVPHYRETLGAAGYRPGMEVDEALWSRLPVLTRRDLQKDPAALRARSYPQAHGGAKEHRSSGSTGVPIAVLKTELCDLLWEAITLRDHAWHRRELGGSLASIRARHRETDAAGDGLVSAIWNQGVNAVYRTGPGLLFSAMRPLSEQIAWLKRRQPDYLQANPTFLRELLRAVERNGARLERLKGVTTYSELVPPGLREETRRVLGVEMRDLYTCRELGYLALECPDHPHYHVQSELVLVEILDAEGRACRPGEIGRVVATPLHNFATPLIRYELGDHAEAGPPCPCGRGLPVLARILGRSRNMFRLPGGDGKWLELLALERRQELPIVQYQLAQTGWAEIEARIVAARPFTAEEEAALRAIVTGPVGAEGCAVRIVYRDAIPRLPSGKYEDFVCEIP